MFEGRMIWSFVLVPGLMTVGTARLVSNMPGMSEVELTIFLFLSALVNLGICFGFLHVRLRRTRKREALEAVIRRPSFVAAVCVVSVLNGVLLAAAYENGWINSAVRWVTYESLGLTKTTQHSTLHFLLRNIYDDTGVFPDHRQIDRQRDDKGDLKTVRVLKVGLRGDGTMFLGYLAEWWTPSQVGEVYLSPACRGDGGAWAPIAGAGAFIRLDELASVEFLDEEAAQCARDLRREPPPEAKGG